MNRKSNSNFNPKATLVKLSKGEPSRILDDNQRKALIDQYLDVSFVFFCLFRKKKILAKFYLFIFDTQFKQLMLKFDPDEDEEDAPAHPGNVSATTPQKSSQESTPQSLKVVHNLANTPSAAQDQLSTPVMMNTPNPAERGNFPYTQQDTRVSEEFFFCKTKRAELISIIGKKKKQMQIQMLKCSCILFKYEGLVCLSSLLGFQLISDVYTFCTYSLTCLSIF